jgi:hypothetical protein
VRGQEHRATLGDRLADQPAELLLHERVQTAGRLVDICRNPPLALRPEAGNKWT